MLATSPALAGGLGLGHFFSGIAHAEEDLIAAADQAVNVLEFEAVARKNLPPWHYAYLATGAGYEPPRPASDPEELAALQQAFIRATTDLRAIGQRIETISARAAIRPAA